MEPLLSHDEVNELIEGGQCTFRFARKVEQAVLKKLAAQQDASADTSSNDDSLTIAYMSGLHEGKRMGQQDAAAIRNAALEEAAGAVEKSPGLPVWAESEDAIEIFAEYIRALKTDQQEKEA